MKNLLGIVIVFGLLSLSPLLAQDDDFSEILTDVAPDEPGVVVLLDDGEDQYIALAGAADLTSGEAISADDFFRIGSITKTFTATVTLQLYDEGLVDLDETIDAYLPAEVVNQIANAPESTLRNLLNMTSGIFSYTESEAFDDASLDNPTYSWTAAETIEYIYAEDAYFPVGEGYYYSNSNYNLLQMIIEAVTGNSLAEEFQTRIFEPLGMDDTYLETPDRFAQNIVRGYADYDGEMVDITEVNDGVGLGDGGIVSKASDLAKFPRGISELLSAEAFNEMKDFVDDGEGGQYGLGIGTTETDYGILLGHDGSTSGFQSDMEYLVEDDLVFIALTNNFDSEIMEDIRDAAFEWWFSE